MWTPCKQPHAGPQGSLKMPAVTSADRLRQVHSSMLAHRPLRKRQYWPGCQEISDLGPVATLCRVSLYLARLYAILHQSHTLYDQHWHCFAVAIRADRRFEHLRLFVVLLWLVTGGPPRYVLYYDWYKLQTCDSCVAGRASACQHHRPTSPKTHRCQCHRLGPRLVW